MVGDYDSEKLVYPWNHSDPALDDLSTRIFAIVASAEEQKSSRASIFERIWQSAAETLPGGSFPLPVSRPQRTVPFLSEPWYC
jgi:hypothetical protein